MADDDAPEAPQPDIRIEIPREPLRLENSLLYLCELWSALAHIFGSPQEVREWLLRVLPLTHESQESIWRRALRVFLLNLIVSGVYVLAPSPVTSIVKWLAGLVIINLAFLVLGLLATSPR
jgi:hypothetical protein